MSVPPSYKKASSYSAVKSPYSTQSTFYTQAHNTPRLMESRAFGSSIIGSSYITKDSKLQEVHQKYEKEAQAVNENYVKHYQSQLEIGDTLMHTQGALDQAKRRNSTLETRLDDCFREMDQHKRQKLELAREASELREELRRKDGLLADREQKLTNVQHNAVSVNFENEGFRHEMKHLSETYNQKLKEIEEKYKGEIKEFTEEIDRLKSQMKDQDISTQAKVRGISRDLEAKVRSLENQMREKDRIMNESAHEIRTLKEYNVKVKMEFEEELRRQVIIIKDKERASYETATKELENRVKELELEKETVEKKIPELVQDIKNRDKMLKDLKLKADEQIRALRKEHIDLNDHISEMGTEIERLQREVTGKDVVNAKIHDEIQHLNLELGYQKDKFIPEIDRLIAKNDADIKRFQEYERKLKARIVELERMIKAGEAENSRLKTDVERLKQQITGSIHKTISEVFVDYGTSNLEGKSMF